MSQLVNAYKEIVSVKIGNNIVSMTIAEKENESGIKYNERLFILVHDEFIGYISKVKITDPAESIDINSAKVKIPIKNLFTFEVEQEILKIKFTYQEDGRIIPKQWAFKMATGKLAELWKQLLQYEVKMRGKSVSQTKRSNQSLDKKSPRREPAQKSFQKTPKVQNKKPPPPQTKVKSPPKEQVSVVQIKNPQATGSFDDSLFSEESQDDKKQRLKKAKGKAQIDKKQTPRKQVQQDSKPTNSKSKPSLKPLQMDNLAPQQPPPVKKQQNSNQRNSNNKQQNLTGSRFFKKQPEVDLPPIQQEVESQHSVEVASFKKTPVKITQSQPKPKRQIKKTMTSQQIEVDFMNNILKQLEQKNKKFPISQITYDRQEMNTLINAYKDKMQVPINQSKTELLLNRIMEHQKSKMMKISKNSTKTNKSWVYNQIVLQQSKCLFQFQQHCKMLVKLLSSQILKGQFIQFRKLKVQNNILYLTHQDLSIKVLGATNKQDSNIKLFQSQKKFKSQFKFYHYLKRIIQNTGVIRVPLTALCQFGGLIVFFKVIPVYYDNQNDKAMQNANKNTENLARISGFPLKQMLKLRPLNEFFYSEMRQGQTTVNFKYYFVDEVVGLSNIENVLLKSCLVQKDQDLSLKQSFSKDQIVGNKPDLQIKNVISSINNFDFYFIHPKQLTKFLHSNGLNLIYLGQVYSQVENQFVSSCLLAEIMSRISKYILKKKLQNIWINQRNSSQSFDQIENILKQQIINFSNCLLGNNKENEALWREVIKKAEQYYRIKIQNENNVNKGQLLISLSHHLGFKIQWNLIDTNRVFGNEPFFKPNSLTNILIKTKSYKPYKNQQILQIKQKMTTESQENFCWLVDKLNLKQNLFPNCINLHSLDQKLKIYLSKYIEPQQLDWSTNFAHLSIYVALEPTLIAFQIDLQMIKWYLKKDNKFKYLNKFTEITKKIERLYGNNHPTLSNLYQIFSQHHQSNNQIEDSINFMKSSILNFSALGGDNNQTMASKFYKMASLLIQFRRETEAMDYLRKAKRITETAQGKKSFLYTQIKLQLAVFYFKNGKYTQTLSELQNLRPYLQIYQKQIDTHEQQRLKFYQLIHLSCNKLNKTNQLISLSNSLEPKLNYFKVHTNFQQILWIIIQNNIKALTPQNKQSVFKVISLIKTKQSINFYKKSYELLRKRYNQNTLFSLFKTYCANSTTITEMVVSNNILSGWQNLSKVHDRQSLFDFISMFEEFIYLFGRETLNSIRT